MRPLKKRRDNFIKKVMVVTLFTILFLWVGFYLRFTIEARKNAELVARRDSLSTQIEELMKELSELRENRAK